MKENTPVGVISHSLEKYGRNGQYKSIRGSFGGQSMLLVKDNESLRVIGIN